MEPEIPRQSRVGVHDTSSPLVCESAPLVSVVMLTFNHESYIHDAVSSIVLQKTNFSFELVIGDDCSSDASLDILRALQKAHPSVIRLITSESNVGMWKNAERLVMASRGEFIAFCEGDDYWSDPRKMQIQVDFLTRNSQYGAVHTGFEAAILRSSKWRLGPGRALPAAANPVDGEIFLQLLRGNFIQTCTFLARSKLVKAALGSRLKYASYPVVDWPMFLHISASSPIGYIASSTAVYRRVAGSAMNLGSARALEVLALYEPMLEDVFDLFDVEACDRVGAISSLHCANLSAALIAGHAAAFDASWAWLNLYTPGALVSFRRRIMPFFAHHEVPRLCLLWLLGTRTRLLEFINFRRESPPVRA